MVSLLHRLGELCRELLTAAKVMNAQLKKTARYRRAPGDDTVVMDFRPWPTEPVAASAACGALHFELEPYEKEVRIDKRAQAAAGWRCLGNSAGDVRGCYRRIDAIG